MVSAANVLLDISEANGPKSSEVAAMGHWMVVFLKRCENLPVLVLDNKKTLLGAEAIAARYEKCLALDDSQVPDTNDLKEFRMFRWMLSKDMEKHYNEWQRKAVETSKARLQASKLQALEDLKEKVGKQKKDHLLKALH